MHAPETHDFLASLHPVRRLGEIEDEKTPAPIYEPLLEAPEATWRSWTLPQRRELLRLLFSQITLRHAGNRGGPVADPTRISFTWATD